MDFKQLNLVFNIGQIEYKTVKSIPKEIQLEYLSRFKREFTIDEFDEFIGLGDPYVYGSDKTTLNRESIMNLYDITIPSGIISFSKERVRERRESNKEFNRELKLKMIL
jgi:hypothetical protein